MSNQQRTWEFARGTVVWPADVDPETLTLKDAIADDRLTSLHLLALRFRFLRDAVNAAVAAERKEQTS